MLKKQTKTMLVLGAATLITSTTVISTAKAEGKLGKCIGGNTCRGQSAGATATSQCAGKNACKGQGWVKADKKTCDKLGGQFKPLK